MHPIEIENKILWEITVLNLNRKDEEIFKYDAVIVCNGHYSDPFIPNVRGSERFKGKQWHSHDYREPSSFAGKKVLLVGAGPSGVDIGAQIVALADKVKESAASNRVKRKERLLQVYLSHSNQLKVPPAQGIIQKPYLTELTKHSAIFQDGTEEAIDEVLYCTGMAI